MSIHHGFLLTHDSEIAELHARARRFTHLQTGADLLSIEIDDPNKVFGITLRTPPTDSTGLPHILEHSVLCGSRNYPVKEPFVELLKGSLKTFLNAMTYPDKTCYPVASLNLTDFYNLASVYFDAVFHPLLTPETLMQEGWHYELESPEAPLKYRGVVFNEMKGAQASPTRTLYQAIQQSLFPDTLYAVDSGGEPSVIPNLQYSDFKRFHETYYQPTNALFFFYGDDEPEERLRFLDERLRTFERGPEPPRIPLQPRFAEPRQERRQFAVTPGSLQKAMVAVNWLLPEPADIEALFGLNTLAELLIGSPGAPLRKALIDSGLGDDLTGSNFCDYLRQMFFSVGLKNIEPQNATTVETLILQTLAGLAETGIEPDAVEAAINTVEFQLRENNSGSSPRGLTLMLNALSVWMHGGDPLSVIAFEKPLAVIRQRLDQGERYFETLIQSHLLENPHRTTVLIEPDSNLSDIQAEAERLKLEEAKAAVPPEGIDALITQTRLLKERQERPDSPQELAKIPFLTLQDLERKHTPIPSEPHSFEGLPGLIHPIQSNGIAYLDLAFDLQKLPLELLPYAEAFGQALLEMGTQKQNYVRLNQRIAQKTGGIKVKQLVTTRLENRVATARLLLCTKAMTPKTGDLLDILAEILLEPKFDDAERFRQIVLKLKTAKETALIQAGHAVVHQRLAGQLSQAGWIGERLSGIHHLFFLRDLLGQIEKDWPTVLENLKTLHRHLVQQNSLFVNLTADPAAMAQIDARLQRFSESLPNSHIPASAWEQADPKQNEGFTIPAQVNYVGYGANLFHLGFAGSGMQTVVSRYLRTSWLWDKIRVQGGAYGGFCSYDMLSGVFCYLSYRDPNLLETLAVCSQSPQFLRDLDLGESELTKAIVGAIGDIDLPRLPDAQGLTALQRFFSGQSDEYLQQMRDQIMATKHADFVAFAEALEAVSTHGSCVVLGSPAAIEQANAVNPGFLSITPLL